MSFGGGIGGGMGGGGGGGGGRRWEMRELAKNERFEWPIVRRMLAAFIPYWPRALFVSVLLILISVGSVLPAWLTQHIIDNGIMKKNFATVLLMTIGLIGVALLTGLLGVIQSWQSNAIAQNVMADYRLSLFRHLQKQTIHFFASRQSGDLVSRVMNDVTAIQNVVTNTFVGLVNNLLIILVTTVFMFSTNWQLTILALIVVPGFVLPTQRVGRVRQRLQGQIQQKLAKLTVQLSETFGVSGAMLTQIFVREKAEIARFKAENNELRDLQIRQTVVGRWFFMWTGMFSSIGPALLWGYGGWLVIHDRIAIGAIVSFTTLLARLYGPLTQLTQLHVNVYSSIALFRRIYALLDIVPQVQDGPVALPEGHMAQGRIEMESVSFTYSTEDRDEKKMVLQDIHLTIEPGRMVALVGPSGAGKTTLMNLIPRFMDPTAGRVTLDGIDIRELTLSSLRSQIGLVPQDPFFFHDTIYNNLVFAREDAAFAEIEEACKAAQIHDLIADLPDGYQTVVGERGYRLSGGERQRLAIARVLLRSPNIVLLDEATSALDSLVERQIQQALEVLLEGRTAVVIAHRLSTVLAADRIVVLKDGRIADQGTHDSLLQSSPLYRELYEAQFAPYEQEANGRLRSNQTWKLRND